MNDYSGFDENGNSHYPEDTSAKGAGHVAGGIEFTEVPSASTMPAADWFASRGMQFVCDITPHVEDDYLIDGVLSIGALSVLYGPSNSGKTFLAMDLAYRISCGYHWHGHKVKQAAVLYYATEGGNGSRNRITALRDTHRDEANSFVPFVLRSGSIDLLSNDKDLELMIDDVNVLKRATERDTVLVLIDTLSRTMPGGDENGSQHMTTVVQRADKLRHATGAHVQLVHHTGKDAGRGARGHSSLRAAVDTEIEVEAGGDERQAIIRKQRDYETGRSYGFNLEVYEIGRRKSDGDAVTTCIAVQAGAKPGWSLKDKAAIMARIEAKHESGEPFTSHKNGRERWVGHVIKEVTGLDDDGKIRDVIEALIRNSDVEDRRFTNREGKERSGLFVRQKSE